MRFEVWVEIVELGTSRDGNNENDTEIKLVGEFESRKAAKELLAHLVAVAASQTKSDADLSIGSIIQHQCGWCGELTRHFCTEKNKVLKSYREGVS